MVSGDELVRRSAERVSWREVVAGRPDGPEWWPLDRLDALPANDWFGELLAGTAKGQRDVAGAYLASYLVETVIGATSAALVHDAASWAVRPDTFRVRRHEQGWFDGLAVDAGEVWSVDGERFATEDELFAAVAAGIVATIAPWFEVARGLAPYGRFGMWGSLADAIGSAALEPVRLDRDAAERAWERAQHLLDRIAAVAPALRVRPRLRTIGWSGGEACVTTQGTCCLYYKVHDPADGGEQYCLGCPLRPTGESDPLYSAWLEREHGPAAAG
jgi:ferric iron reductase protein FhuF